MKKELRTMMSLAALLALVSCGASVTEEVAKQRAQEITERRKQEDFVLPSKFTFIAIYKRDMTVITGGQKETKTVTGEEKMVLDLENYYYYYGDTSFENGKALIFEEWFYIEENTAIYAMNDFDLGKTYEDFTIESPDQFAASFDFAVDLDSVYSVVLNSEYLQIESLDETFAKILENAGLTGNISTSVSYTSTSEGNLGINAKTKIKDGSMQGNSASANLNVVVSFDNYLLMNTMITLKLNASEPTTGLTMPIIEEETVTINYGVASNNKPNLTEFTKEG